MTSDTRDDYEKGYVDGRLEGVGYLIDLLAKMILLDDNAAAAQERSIRQLREQIRYRQEQTRRQR